MDGSSRELIESSGKGDRDQSNENDAILASHCQMVKRPLRECRGWTRTRRHEQRDERGWSKIVSILPKTRRLEPRQKRSSHKSRKMYASIVKM